MSHTQSVACSGLLATNPLTAPGAPFELIEELVEGRLCRVFRHGPRAIADVYAEAMAYTDALCLSGPTGTLTYSELFTKAAALKAALAEAGLGKGDRVAIAMHNRPEWIVAFVAVSALGATAVLVNYRASATELMLALEDTQAKALIAEPFIAVHVAEGWRAERLVILTAGEQATSLPGALAFDDVLVCHAGASFQAAAMGPGDEAVVIFSTGTTGAPKGILLSQRALMTTIMGIDYSMANVAIQAGAPLESLTVKPAVQPSVMLVYPLFHSSGLNGVLLPSLRRGGKIVMISKWRVGDVIDLLEQERLAGFSGSPAMLWDLLKAPREGRDLSNLRFLSVGGQGITPKLLSELTTAFPGVMVSNGYGQTETGSVNGIAGQNLLDRPTSSGRPIPIVDVRIVDDAGVDVPPGEVGEICIAGATIMIGYCNRPEDTARTKQDGWVATGDLGRLDADGYLHVVDRKKNIVISGGENIGCAEVEAVALTHPAVDQAAAFGVPDDRLGEVLLLAVVLRKGQATDAATLIEHFAGKIARYKVPRGILFMNALPLNALDKVDRRALAVSAVKREA
ncbi:class I adenylate-forming enzyme family protein [Sphingobium sp. EM0848]|uniref:class I adenylate-forming enzyme family protein n=1 Tax=Sphingobium sp. EM0848 TaxID=2743473 RepID=UPI00159CA7F9|nr:class I adenylate-forming enzyme family protein [Sphingobium sp. EM0848]